MRLRLNIELDLVTTGDLDPSDVVEGVLNNGTFQDAIVEMGTDTDRPVKVASCAVITTETLEDRGTAGCYYTVNARMHFVTGGYKTYLELPTFDIWHDSPEQACGQAARILPDLRGADVLVWHTGTVTSADGLVFTLPVVKP